MTKKEAKKLKPGQFVRVWFSDTGCSDAIYLHGDNGKPSMQHKVLIPLEGQTHWVENDQLIKAGPMPSIPCF